VVCEHEIVPLTLGELDFGGLEVDTHQRRLDVVGGDVDAAVCGDLVPADEVETDLHDFLRGK